VRIRERSSPNTTSRPQTALFSMAQRSRQAASPPAALARGVHAAAGGGRSRATRGSDSREGPRHTVRARSLDGPAAERTGEPDATLAGVRRIAAHGQHGGRAHQAETAGRSGAARGRRRAAANVAENEAVACVRRSIVPVAKNGQGGAGREASKMMRVDLAAARDVARRGNK
jgi:hypothetical protein